MGLVHKVSKKNQQKSPLWQNIQQLNQIPSIMNENMKIILEQRANEKDRALEKDFYRKLMTQYSLLLKQLNQKIDEVTLLSITDPLLNIYNRGKLVLELQNEVQRVKRYDPSLSMLLFDIDHFKGINDTYGHDVGDKVLQEFSKRIVQGLRETDIFGRWGGEEFVAILPETGKDGAITLAERLRLSIEATPFEVAGTITCSIGISQCVKDDSMETLIKRADEGLYMAKEGGRNQAHFSSLKST